MAIVNSIATFTGVGAQYASVINTIVTTTGSPQTIRVPSGTVNFSPAVCRGYWRIKVYNFTSAVTFNSVNIQAGDGTNLVTIDDFVPVAAISITATAWVDICGDFLFDQTTAGGGATGGLIAFGATFFNFITTMATASGSASADCEIAAEP